MALETLKPPPEAVNGAEVQQSIVLGSRRARDINWWCCRGRETLTAQRHRPKRRPGVELTGTAHGTTVGTR